MSLALRGFSLPMRVPSQNLFTALAVCALVGIVTGCRFFERSNMQSENVKPTPRQTITDCAVVIAGGSTAALAAALASAEEGAKTCLLEPTDWAGGQLTSSGVSAIDFAWHKSAPQGGVDVGALSRNPANQPKLFAAWVALLGEGINNWSKNPGACWVSLRCYLPEMLLIKGIIPALNAALQGAVQGSPGATKGSAADVSLSLSLSLSSSLTSSELPPQTAGQIANTPNLRIFYNTVPKRVSASGRRITTLEAITRTPNSPGIGYDMFLSEEIDDWYQVAHSHRYSKTVLKFQGPTADAKQSPVFIDATEWGELLVLSGASYLQGVEKSEGSLEAHSDTCGQAIVFPLALDLSAQGPVDIPPIAKDVKADYPEHFALNEPGKSFSWVDIWNYRRIHTLDPSRPAPQGVRGPLPETGDISMQNWVSGNDYPYRYLFLPKANRMNKNVQSDWKGAIADWKGGIDKLALAEAERHSIGWYVAFKNMAPKEYLGRVGLAVGTLESRGPLGTRTGLAKVPYIRDTRRSVGLDDFVVRYRPHLFEGERFADRIAIGAYDADIHPTLTCTMPPYIVDKDKPAALPANETLGQALDAQPLEKNLTKPSPQPSTTPVPQSSGNPDLASQQNRPLPFYLPLRALTNRDFDNLLVAGKTMAQTFLANAATRLHPIEFASGVGAGVTGAHMATNQRSSRQALEAVGLVQQAISRYQPLEWTLK